MTEGEGKEKLRGREKERGMQMQSAGQDSIGKCAAARVAAGSAHRAALVGTPTADTPGTI